MWGGRERWGEKKRGWGVMCVGGGERWGVRREVGELCVCVWGGR